MERVATEDGPTAHSPPSQPATGHLSSRLPWFCRESWGGGGRAVLFLPRPLWAWWLRPPSGKERMPPA